jgi:hypothetical protein
MADTEKYAEDMQSLIDQVKALDKALTNSEYGFKLTELIESYGSLFDRFCPFRVGDRVQLSKTPEINEKTSWGWIGSKHFLVDGAKARVTSRGYRNGLFCFGLVFDDESWINSSDGSLNPVDRPNEYTFNEDFVEAEDEDIPDPKEMAREERYQQKFGGGDE